MSAKSHSQARARAGGAGALAGGAGARGERRLPAFSFEPGAFAKAHAPLNQPAARRLRAVPVHLHRRPGERLGAGVNDAPELTQAGAHPDFTAHFRFAQTGPTQRLSARRPRAHDHHRRPRRLDRQPPGGAALRGSRLPPDHLRRLPEGEPGRRRAHGSPFGAVGDTSFFSPVSSLVPAPGQPGLLGFKSFAFTALLIPEVRSDGDYGLRVSADDIPIPLTDYIGTTLTLWGVPHDPVHDPLPRQRRRQPRRLTSPAPRCPSSPRRPTAPAARSTSRSKALLGGPRPVGRRRPPPRPSRPAAIRSNSTRRSRAQPTTNVADQPTGLEVDVHTPQNNDACKQIKPFPALTNPSTTAASPPPTSRTPRSPCRRAW